MVHKKSEYGLQFRELTNDIRTQIWRENYLFREAQKRINLSDHYWCYQLIDDTCDCDGSAEELSRSKNILVENVTESNPIVSVDAEIQPSPRKSMVREPPSVEIPTTERSISPSWVAPLSIHNDCNRGKTSEDPTKLSKNKHNRSVEIVSSKPVHSHSNTAPTRGAIKSYQQQQKIIPVFAAFGWNDSEKNVGDQKTYNVRAPVDQVYNSALLASGKRYKELELHFSEQLRKKRQQQSLLSLGPVNLSSIWMTEYQESFSKGKREPLCRTPFSRPVVWRYT